MAHPHKAVVVGGARFPRLTFCDRLEERRLQAMTSLGL